MSPAAHALARFPERGLERDHLCLTSLKRLHTPRDLLRPGPLCVFIGGSIQAVDHVKRELRSVALGEREDGREKRFGERHTPVRLDELDLQVQQ